jgi:hypothetical protein
VIEASESRLASVFNARVVDWTDSTPRCNNTITFMDCLCNEYPTKKKEFERVHACGSLEWM